MSLVWRRMRKTEEKWEKLTKRIWVCRSQRVGVLIYIFILVNWKLVNEYDEGILGIKIEESK